MPTLESLQKEIEDLKRQNETIINVLNEITSPKYDGLSADKVAQKHEAQNVSESENEAQLGQVIKDLEAQPAVAAKTPESLADKKENQTGLEEKIGKKWFAFIGIFAVVIGVGFFVKYLSDNGFLGPVIRIILGVFAGVLLIIGGEIASRFEKYAKWGKVLVGGGLAVVYFIVYAAYNFVEYRTALGITQGVDIFFLGLVALITIFFSLKDNSPIVAAEALLLGLITCLLSADFGYLMLVYNLFLAIAATVVVVYKKWPLLGLAGVFGTFIVYSFWRQSNNDFSIGAIFLVSYFLCYAIQFALAARQDKAVETEGKIIAANLVNSVFFFAAGMELVRSFYPEYDALFCLGLAIFHLGSFGLAYFFNREKIAQAYFYLGLAFLALAIPLYFERSLITITWSVLGVVLIASFLKTKYRPLEYCYYGLSVILAWKVLLFDSRLESFSWDDFSGGTRALAFGAAAVCFFLCYFLIARQREKLSPSMKEAAPYFYSIFPVFILFLLPILEGGDNSQFLTIYWSAVFAVLLTVSWFKSFFEFRLAAVLAGTLIFLKMFWYDLVYKDWFSHLAEDWRIWAYLLAIVLFYGAYALAFRQKKLLTKGMESLPTVYSWLGAGALFIMLWLELSGYWISVGWAVLALALVLLGFVLNKRELRYQGIAVLAMTILKVFLYDTSKLESIYRTISFMVLGAILLAASFLYNKYKDKIKEIL